jgi:hypothetical protein
MITVIIIMIIIEPIYTLKHASYLESWSLTSRLLLSPKVRYRVHKSPPLVPILNYPSPVYNLQHYFSRMNFNIIIPPLPKIFRVVPSLQYFQKTSLGFTCAMRAACPSHLIVLDLINIIVFGTRHYAVSSTFLYQNILPSIRLSNSRNLCSFLKREIMFHSY